MAHAKSKVDLLGGIRKERKALEKLVTTLSPAHMTLAGVMGEWSVKDILAHLVEWEQMFLGWYHAGQDGLVPHTPAEGYKWNQLPALNQRIYECYRERGLEEVCGLFENSFREIFHTVEGMTEAELFDGNFYCWTNKHPLAGWIESNTSSHYRWARNGIRKGLKQVDN